MKSSIVLFLFHIPVFCLGQQCATSEQITSQLLGSGSTFDKISNTEIDTELKVEEWSFKTVSSKLELEGTVKFLWKNSNLAFNHLNSCQKQIVLDETVISAPDLSFIPSPDSIHNKNRLKYVLDETGVLEFTQSIQTSVPCTYNKSMYPFGDITCSLVLDYSKTHNNNVTFDWSKMLNNTEKLSNLPLKSSTFYLQDGVFSSERNKEIQATFTFSHSFKETLIHFFIPSVTFMIPAWLTLLLGPMAITRCIMLMCSMILLTIHYNTSNFVVGLSTELDAITLWKSFSYIFVIFILIELVCVTVLASIGRSSVGCCSKKNGNFETEPLYEEMNDLRKRKSRKTSNFCRKFALFIDLTTFLLTGLVFLLFSYCYYNQRNIVMEQVKKYETLLFL